MPFFDGTYKDPNTNKYDFPLDKWIIQYGKDQFVEIWERNEDLAAAEFFEKFPDEEIVAIRLAIDWLRQEEREMSLNFYIDKSKYTTNEQIYDAISEITAPVDGSVVFEALVSVGTIMTGMSEFTEENIKEFQARFELMETVCGRVLRTSTGGYKIPEEVYKVMIGVSTNASTKSRTRFLNDLKQEMSHQLERAIS